MALVVQKYGGSSVGDVEKVKNVARRIIETKQNGNKVVTIVSAMGKTTDNLISLANQLNPNPPERELDLLMATGEMQSSALLAMCIQQMGEKAVALTGEQVGIFTDGVHTKARIVKIEPDRVFKELDEENIVIVAGFQGLANEADIATLGRGGSDTTAVAIAAALKADVCEIYTDVDGIFTSDPRVVPDAKKIEYIDFDEMLELSSLGAKVMQVRSIEFAKKYNVDVHVRSSFHKGKGTLITSAEKIKSLNQEEKKMEEPVVRAVTSDKSQAKIALTDLPDKPGIAAKIFGTLADKKINVDMIIQSSSAQNSEKNDISFTVSKPDFNKAKEIVETISNEIGAGKVITDTDVAKVSIVGVGMKTHPGVAAKMFAALGENNINIQMISTSEIKVSCVVKEEKADDAVRIVHSAFALSE